MEDEIKARKEWNETRNDFKTQNENDLKELFERNSLDQFLAAVILSPGFEKIDCCVSSRSDYKRNHGRVGNIRRELNTRKNLVPVL